MDARSDAEVAEDESNTPTAASQSVFSLRQSCGAKVGQHAVAAMGQSCPTGCPAMANQIHMQCVGPVAVLTDKRIENEMRRVGSSSRRNKAKPL